MVVVEATDDADGVGNHHVITDLAVAFDGAELADMDVVANDETPWCRNLGANAEIEVPARLHVRPDGVELEDRLPQRAQARQKESHGALPCMGVFSIAGAPSR